MFYYTWDRIEGQPKHKKIGPKRSLISSNMAQGLYTKVGHAHSPIPCGVLGDTLLMPNLQAGLTESGRALSRPELSTWVGFNPLDNEHLYVGP